MLDYKDKTYLVTGGTTGIGAATVAALAQAGAKVVTTGRNPATIAAARKTLPTNAELLQSDAGKSADIKALATHMSDRYGKLDGLVLNAGIAPFMPLEEWSEEAANALFTTNVTGPFLLTQQLAPVLQEGASIVFNTSVIHGFGMPGASLYSASKGALIAIVRSLAVELGPRRIRVNAVAPGPIDTPLYGKLGMPEDQLGGFHSHITSRVPLGRFGTAEDVAGAFLYLLSDASRYVTGAEIAVDGGISNSVS